MQAITNISIPQPCHQNWNDMTPADQGRHCQSCQKIVVDFTRMTDSEIINYLNTNGKVCGRFTKEKLESVNAKLVSVAKPAFLWQRFAIAASIAMLFNNSVKAEKTAPVKTEQSPRAFRTDASDLTDSVTYVRVKGKVLDEENQGLPGVSVIIKGMQIGTQTNVNGEFYLNVPSTATSLVFSFVGYNTAELSLGSTSAELPAISLKMSSMMLGEPVYVQRPPLHKRVWHKVKRVFKH
ncbi:hypothetical protein D0C36_05415 [Mucilaginibacter conchicola]|uniref:Carboxypeptidase-like regulatory domain-containing protein n=1 Tax=Mucilaginibacter conchicola TaxID=2303333 RepID=A0A372NZN6_9SPHI|nr:carboxypeptidase-like regulatory domain-containing protein [Mucilaginibacter conchicola]RFZ94967.1 hypothetical protein D0C36_05415 [Mucilaginibacter conchicola]